MSSGPALDDKISPIIEVMERCRRTSEAELFLRLLYVPSRICEKPANVAV